MTASLDELAVNTIRGLSMDAVQKANSGHPGTPMALAPLGWAIFNSLRKHNPADPDWSDRDRFVLSCGHASMLQYALLHLSGYDLTLDDIKNFRQWDSLTPGHPEVFHTPGVETTTGPLGQGFANAVGMAMAERHLAERFNREGHEIVDHHVWTIASDGDIMEGVCAEAASLAGHLKLGKLIVFWDDNEITIDGRTELAFSEDVVARFDSYGWHTQSLSDGEDMDAIMHAAAAAKSDPRPSFIRLKTVIGFPAPNKKDTSSAHGSPLGSDEIAGTKKVMGWPETPFHVPSELQAVTKQMRSAGKDVQEAWNKRFADYKSSYPRLAEAFQRISNGGTLPENWNSGLPIFDADPKGMATRAASGKVIAKLAENVPALVGGSADLTGSNKTKIEGSDFRHDQEGLSRTVHWGIREHGMGSAMNGMALHGGVIPFGATFLVFADYMRPAIRLAALMGLPTRYILSHDSIGLGEDGPTHQPVEHLASLRLIPNMTVLRPADANETVECWKAMMHVDGPAAIVLTRQSVPTLDRTQFAPAADAQRGAYILHEPKKSPQVILVGTGSEVHLAIEAAEALAKDGIHARVVSMPSWALFTKQDAAYQDSVFPDTIKARVVVEAGTRFGWERWIGNKGAFVTLDRFGASAPAETLYQKFGITAERVVSEAKRILKN